MSPPSSVSRPSCVVCGAAKPSSGLHPSSAVGRGLSALIRRDHPDWGPGRSICGDHLLAYRTRYVEDLLEREGGELGELERQVIDSLADGTPIAQNTDEQTEARATFGERTADRVASFGGSWTFIGLFVGVLVVWITANSAHLLTRPFDPYPYILLNLALSCIAAIQAPVIMMSQRRSEIRDRLRAENDYGVNLKAELEIRQLHEKLDHQIAHQAETLAEMRRLQAEILAARTDVPRG